MRRLGHVRTLAAVAAAAALLVLPAGASAAKKTHKRATAASAATFSVGQPQASTTGASGCGTNPDGEPQIHVSRDDDVFMASERGLGGGSDFWRALGGVGGSGASGCSLTYSGQPNAVSGVGISGGDVDLAVAPERNALGNFNVYVASLNLGSVYVASSQDKGQTFSQTPVVAGVPVDDREWIAAFGSSTALLTYHDIATNNIDVLRSDDGGATYVQQSTAIPPGDYKALNNELGNIVIDHRNTAGAAPGQFWAYQSFVAPATSSESAYDEAFVAVSSDGGSTFTDKPIACSKSSKDLDHIFPNVSVAPDGTLWYAWSDGTGVYTAHSSDHGDHWSCSGKVSTNTAQAVMPWLVATSAGVDLVYYGSPTAPGSSQRFYVYFAQNLSGSWDTPQQVVAVHDGAVCEEGVNCTTGRQLLDDFGIDTDSQGWAHIAYSHDSPDLGGSGTYTGYAVQTGGSPAGYSN